GLLQALLELPIEHLALLRLGLQLLLEPLLTLRGLRAELIDGGAEIRGRALPRRLFVGDHRAEVGVDRELGLTTRTRHDERRLRHGAHYTGSTWGVRGAPPKPSVDLTHSASNSWRSASLSRSSAAGPLKRICPFSRTSTR